jgi:hypothetical protein
MSSRTAPTATRSPATATDDPSWSPGSPSLAVSFAGSQGSVYVFRRPAGGWRGTLTQSAKVFPGDGAAGDFLGSGVAFAGGSLVSSSASGTTPRGAWVFAEDDAAPVTTIGLRGTRGTGGWFRSPVTVEVTADDGRDGAGAVTTRCMLDPALAPTAFDELTPGCAAGRGAVVSAEGEHVVHAASRDGVGNTEPLRTAPFRIDTTAPTVSCGAIRTFVRGQRGARVPATVADALSGPASAEVLAGVSTGRAGAAEAKVVGADRAGNTATAECAYDVVPSTLPFCGEREVVLVGTERAGRRVRVRGIARARRRGEVVTVLAGGRPVGTAKIARDGRFAALVPAPRSRTSYVAVLGEDRSAAATHDPAFAVDRRRTGRRSTLVSGRAPAGRLALVRRTGCAKRVRAGTVRVSGGRFTVRLRPGLVDVAQFELVAGTRRLAVAVP